MYRKSFTLLFVTFDLDYLRFRKTVKIDVTAAFVNIRVDFCEFDPIIVFLFRNLVCSSNFDFVLESTTCTFINVLKIIQNQ